MGSSGCPSLTRCNQRLGGVGGEYHVTSAARSDSLWHVSWRALQTRWVRESPGELEKTPGGPRRPEQRHQNLCGGENQASVPFKVPRVLPM